VEIVEEKERGNETYEREKAEDEEKVGEEEEEEEEDEEEEPSGTEAVQLWSDFNKSKTSN
jgi:hypothetical protein